MSYEVTATKKRPQGFDELAGQEFVVATLKNSLKAERIAHAYLFAGPRGVGKTSAARILAKALNCETGPTDEPCGTCSNCEEIARGNSLDVIEIDGASNTSVNDVREIKDEVLFAPNSGRYKVYIIDEVHMLSNSAFNALLKTIEEPPPYIVFIFATTEVHKVPATIRSRCQQFNFRLIAAEVIKELLQSVADEMNVSAEADALFWIAKEATGSIRDAYTLFDQIVSFSEGEITLEKIREKLGLVGLDEMNEIAEDIVSGNPESLLERMDRVLCQGVSVEQFLVDLAEYFRNILFIRHGLKKEGILGGTVDRYSGTVREAFSPAQLEAALEMVLNLYRNIRYSLNQRFELELLLSRLASLKGHISSEELYSRIKALKKELFGGEQKISSSREPQAVVQDTTSAETAGTQDSHSNKEILDTGELRSDIITGLKKSKLALASALEKTDSWVLDGDRLKIIFKDSYSATLVRTELGELRKMISRIYGKDIEIDIELEESAEEEQAREDDQVELAKKIFRGEIVSGE